MGHVVIMDNNCEYSCCECCEYSEEACCRDGTDSQRETEKGAHFGRVEKDTTRDRGNCEIAQA